MISQQLHKLISEFLSHVGDHMRIIDSVLASNPSLYSEYKDAYSLLEKAEVGKDIDWAVQSNIAALFAEYDNICDTRDKILGAMRLINTIVLDESYTRAALYNKSTSYGAEIQKNRDDSNNVLNAYIHESEAESTRVWHIVTPIIKKHATVLFDWIMDTTAINPFTTFVTKILLRVLDSGRGRQLQLRIESQKDKLLSVERFTTPYTGIQSQLVRYGLRPATPSHSASEIIKLLMVANSEHDSEDNTNSDAICEDNDIVSAIPLLTTIRAVVLIDKSSKSCIEYNTRGIIDADYVVRENLSPTAGLNETFVKRFTTMIKLTPEKSDNAVRVFESPTTSLREEESPTPSESAWILETIDGHNYRILTNILSGKDYSTPTNSIIGLLHGISSRCREYNKIHSRIICDKYFDILLVPLLRDYSDMKQSVISSDPIKNTIHTQLMDAIHRTLKDNYPNDLSEVVDIITDHAMISPIIITQLYMRAGGNDAHQAESTLTFISKVEGILHLFTKELRIAWSGLRVSPRILEKVSELLSLISEAIRASMDRLDIGNYWTEYDQSIKEFVINHKELVI